MWQNTAYSNKWFYAFIKKMTMSQMAYTDVFEVDPLQRNLHVSDIQQLNQAL